MHNIKIDISFFINFAAIFFISIGVIFFENPSFFYLLSFLIIIFNYFQKRIISKSVLRVFFTIFIILLFSFSGPFFDFKFILNTLGFIVISLMISTIIIYENKSSKITSAFLNLILLISIICLLYLFFSSNYLYIFKLDFNTAFLKIYENIGIFKQIQSQLLALTFLYVLYILKFNKFFKFCFLLSILLLMIGSRSIFFGFLCLIIIKLFSNKYRFLICLSILLFHYVFIFYIVDNPFFDLLFQFDPRWGMQAISIFTSQDYLFGIGYGGWNEYAVTEVGYLLKYSDYLPFWQGYDDSNTYIPTTLESSLFQMNAEIGMILTIFMFMFLFKLTLKGIQSNDPFLKLFSTFNTVIIFSSFYEDNLLQPFWYIVFSIYVGIYFKQKLINQK
tara:strand:- start:786 stop:1952 length:1167 start_codon:yes stop_codon:yes gene_type:complete